MKWISNSDLSKMMSLNIFFVALSFISYFILNFLAEINFKSIPRPILKIVCAIVSIFIYFLLSSKFVFVL